MSNAEGGWTRQARRARGREGESRSVKAGAVRSIVTRNEEDHFPQNLLELWPRVQQLIPVFDKRVEAL